MSLERIHCSIFVVSKLFLYHVLDENSESCWNTINTENKICETDLLWVKSLLTQHAVGDGESECGPSCHPPARGEIGQLCS